MLPAAVECGVADIVRETGRPRDATLLKKADPMTDLKQIRVFTDDDHPLMRRGIAGEVNEQTDMKVVVEAVGPGSYRYLPDTASRCHAHGSSNAEGQRIAGNDRDQESISGRALYRADHCCG